MATPRRNGGFVLVTVEPSAGEFLGVFARAGEGYGADADFSARMFFNAGGVREDPATRCASAGGCGPHSMAF